MTAHDDRRTVPWQDGSWTHAPADVEPVVSGLHVTAVLGRTVTVRASWAGDALTIRARVDAEPFRLVRVLPFPHERVVSAGPYVCAPTRAGLTVPLVSWETTRADAALH